MCKIRLLENDELGPGDEAFVQLMFNKEVAVRNGDNFILRFFSPVITIGGGVIIDANAKKHSRNRKEVIKRLQSLSTQSPGERLMERISQSKTSLWDIKTLAQDMTEKIRELYQNGNIVFPDADDFDENKKFTSKSLLDVVFNDVEDALRKFHKENPLLGGINQAQLRKTLPFEGKADCDRVLSYYEKTGRIKISAGEAALADFEILYTPEQEKLREEVIAFYEEAGVKSPDDKVVAENFSDRADDYNMIALRLRRDGILVNLSDKNAVLKKYEEIVLNKFKELSGVNEEVTLAGLKEAMDFSRKYAQLYLEYWDRTAVTRRIGDAHILRVKEENK